jgi:cell division inhibitor SepF
MEEKNVTIVQKGIDKMVDFLVKGFEQKNNVFAQLGEAFRAEEDYEDDIYEIEDNLALAPAHNYQTPPKFERESNSKVVPLPNVNRGYEVTVMEPRSFEDAAQIAINLKDRKTIILNLHLLDKEQSQRTIDFVCGAAHALNGTPQKVGDLVFIFTPSNVTLSVDAVPNYNKFNDSLWTRSV